MAKKGEKKRKKRKQDRKKIQKSFKQWLEPINSKLMSLSRKITREKTDRLKNLPIHKRFLCPKCKRLYCINNDGNIIYCKTDCYIKEFWFNCAKRVQGEREC